VDGNVGGAGSFSGCCEDGVHVGDNNDWGETEEAICLAALALSAMSCNSLSVKDPILNTLRNVLSSKEWNTSIRLTGESRALCCGLCVRTVSSSLEMREVNAL